MAQQTVVFQVGGEAGELLRKRLGEGPFEFREVPHAVFSAKGEGIVATLYRSGKLVLQGNEPELFAARYMPDAESPSMAAPATRPEGSRSAAVAPSTTSPKAAPRPGIGSDEAGKGDYFGPLCVAAVRLDEGDLAKLMGAEGIRDSKRTSDEKAQRLGAAIEGLVPTAIQRLDPTDYNREYREAGNLNELLAALHARVLGELAEPGIYAIVDRFANESVMVRHTRGLELELDQRPRAEDFHPAVAAASLVARASFLEGLAELSDEFAIELRKGAGPPVEAAAHRFVDLHGPDRLAEVAKLHFKTTESILRGR